LCSAASERKYFKNTKENGSFVTVPEAGMMDTKMKQDLEHSPALYLRLCAGRVAGMFTHCKI
jgi:hypothetical protein